MLESQRNKFDLDDLNKSNIWEKRKRKRKLNISQKRYISTINIKR